MIPHSILALFAMSNGGDDDRWSSSSMITLSLGVFSIVITIVFLLGACAGYVIGKYHSITRDGRVVAGQVSKSRRGSKQPSSEGSNDNNGDRQQPSATNNNNNMIDKQEISEEDGPTMVLRGSLELMASKWKCNDEQQHLTQHDGRAANNKSSKEEVVVEYLSPDEMTKLLFSKIGDGHGEENRVVSSWDTLCLDEHDHHHGDKSNNKNDSSNSKEEKVPSPKSSATDIVNLLLSPSYNQDNNTNNTKDNNSPITPAAFLNLLSLLQKYSVNTSHPYFFNQLFGSLDPIALAAEIVALSVNTSVYTYETAPVFTLLEREVMGQIGRLVFGGVRDAGDDAGDEEDKGDGKDEGEEESETEEEFEGEGLMIPGGSLANLTAMHAARHRWRVMNGYTRQKETTTATTTELALEDSVEERQHNWEDEEEKKMEDTSSHDTTLQSQHALNDSNPSAQPDLVAFVSSEAHYSFSKSARVLGLREDDLIVIPTCSDGRMDVDALAKKIQELEKVDCFEMMNPVKQEDGGRDGGGRITTTATTTAHIGRMRKRVPFFVACTAGSTVRGSFDDIAKIVKVCRDYESRGTIHHSSASSTTNNNNNESSYERSIWVHVDGAWGGSAIFSTNPTLRRHTHMDDIRHADSFTFNPHKMLGAPQQTTAFIVRHRNALRNANAHGAKYLFDPRKNGAEYDLGDLSYTCGRSMRSSCGLCGNTTVKVDWEGVSIKRWRSWNCLWRRLEGGEGGLRWRVSLGRLM